MTARHGHSAEWLRAQLADEAKHYAAEAESFAQEAEDHDEDGDHELAAFKRGCMRAAHGPGRRAELDVEEYEIHCEPREAGPGRAP